MLPQGGRAVAGNTRVLDTEAVWARDYTVITDPVTNLPAALLLPDQILRLRPIAVHR